jgi:hypothetical protein
MFPRKNKLSSSINTHPKFSRRNTNKNSHGVIPSTKNIKPGAIKIKEKSAWRGPHYFIEH